MGVLGDRPGALGASQGVLVATPEGRALYEVLGWRFEGRMETVVIPDEGILLKEDPGREVRPSVVIPESAKRLSGTQVNRTASAQSPGSRTASARLPG